MRSLVVLVAEGNDELRWLLTEACEQERFAVVGVADASNALRCVSEVVPDVIIIDEHLPGPPLAEILPRLLSFTKKSCFVLVTSTDTRPPARTAAFAAGAKAHLSKPFLLTELFALVRNGAPALD